MDFRQTIPDGPFGTILADPPWRLGIGGGQRKLRYDTMALNEIKAMGDRIKEVTEPDAHLWLWTTNPHLPEAFEVVESWGFKYHTLRTWDKGRIGLGWWLRSQTEHLIFASRPAKDYRREIPRKWSTIFRAKYRGHSVKPVWGVYDCIMELSPGPYLELFANTDALGTVGLGLSRMGWTFQESDHRPPPGDPYGDGS